MAKEHPEAQGEVSYVIVKLAWFFYAFRTDDRCIASGLTEEIARERADKWVLEYLV